MPVIAGGILYPPREAEYGQAISRQNAVPNKAHAQWVSRVEKAGPYKAGPEPPEVLTCGGEIPDGPWEGGWWLPRYMIPHGDARSMVSLPIAPHTELQITLRDYQREALAAWVANGGSGTVVAQCGAGKTCIGIAAISRLTTPALVLVHTLDLATQWIERVQTQLKDCTVGLVGAGKREDDARVVVATLQTLARWSWVERCRWGRRFGLVIQDEVHHAPARTFSEVLSSMPARYRMGLTATPHREDGLSDWVVWSCGPIVAEIDNRRLEEVGATMRPKISRIKTYWQPPRDAETYAALITSCCEDEDRNQVLLDVIAGQISLGRITLMLSDRVKHCRHIAAQLNARHGEGTCAALVGTVSKKRRGEILEAARAGTLKAITATTIADEGLDVPSLDTVVLGCPSRHLGRIQQRIGRALRPSPGKGQPMVIDVCDPWGPAMGYAKRRASLYKRLGWE